MEAVEMEAGQLHLYYLKLLLISFQAWIYAHLSAVNMVSMLRMHSCYCEEPFRATPVPVRVCAICRKAIVVQEWIGKPINCRLLRPRRGSQ